MRLFRSGTQQTAMPAIMAAGPPVLDQRLDLPVAKVADRFIGFAFAAAELLVEIGTDRRVRFAAGSFPERFGQEADIFVGRPVLALVDPEDHGGLDVALSLLATRGRLAPVAVRLANQARTCVALSGLCLPDNEGIAWLTLARMPAAAADPPLLAAGPVLRHVMEARLREQQGLDLGLIEVSGWSRIPDTTRRSLETSIGSAMRHAGGDGSVAAELSEGRFGVLAQQGMNLAELEARIVAILRQAGSTNGVGGAALRVTGDAGSKTGTVETMRAMRFALSCFVSGGTSGVARAGFDRGLAGFLDQTEQRALALRAAIDGGRFKLAFQPVVSLADRSVHHYEALLRPLPIAGHPIADTTDFVAFAEAMGLAEVLDTAVLAHATEVLRSTRAKIAINVSGVSMESPLFRDTLMAMVAAEPALAARLIVELTETTDIDDVAAAAETMQGLGRAGVPVCLDDFGAGFASFRYLHDFRVSFVKIDGSYVRQIVNGARERSFIGAMVELASSVNARTIAESIESEAQEAACREQGVKFGQGYLFGRPGALPGSL